MSTTGPAEFEVDGAEGIAFWVTNPKNEETAPVLFDDLDRLDAFLREWFPGRYEAKTDAPLTDLPDPRRVAEFRHRGGGFPSEHWVHSVTIGSNIWINGVRFPWFVHEDGVRVEWGEPGGDDEVRIGRLVLELMVSDDDTIITDLRPGAIS